MSRYKFVAIKLKDNSYNALVYDVDEVVQGRTLTALKREVARVLIDSMNEGKQYSPKKEKVDIRSLYKERTHFEISEEELMNSTVEEIELELHDNNVTIFIG